VPRFKVMSPAGPVLPPPALASMSTRLARSNVFEVIVILPGRTPALFSHELGTDYGAVESHV
jgi:hypothetical protein